MARHLGTPLETGCYSERGAASTGLEFVAAGFNPASYERDVGCGRDFGRIVIQITCWFGCVVRPKGLHVVESRSSDAALKGAATKPVVSSVRGRYGIRRRSRYDETLLGWLPSKYTAAHRWR
jgi:hypothetical protein